MSRIDELIYLLEHRPKAALLLEEVRTSEVFQKWIRRCMVLSGSNPRMSLPHIKTALAIAVLKCESVHCLGLEAAAYRRLGDLEQAREALDFAFKLGGGCSGCYANLLRRRAYLHASFNNREAAIADAEEAIEAHKLLKPGEDHNLSGHGLADSTFCRGTVRQYFGLETNDDELISGAISDFGEALSLANPQDHREIYFHGLLALGYMLRRAGGIKNLIAADDYMREAWKYFSGRRAEASRERSHLNWQTTMVRFELRRHPEGAKRVSHSPAMLRKKLLTARNDFIQLSMPAESIAVAADLARVLYPKRFDIIELMRETNALLRERWPEIPAEAKEGFRPVAEAMRAVRLAAESDVMILGDEQIKSQMRTTIKRLREACEKVPGGQPLPCLLTGWGSEKA